eukprot:30694-Pelagococcus_subviridis.AAC.17
MENRSTDKTNRRQNVRGVFVSLPQPRSPPPRLGRRSASSTSPAAIRIPPAAEILPILAQEPRRRVFSRRAAASASAAFSVVEKHLSAAQFILPSFVRFQQLHVYEISIVHDVLDIRDARDVKLANVAEPFDAR